MSSSLHLLLQEVPVHLSILSDLESLHHEQTTEIYLQESAIVLNKMLSQTTRELNKSRREATLLKVQLRAEIHKLEADLEHSKSETKMLLTGNSEQQQQDSMSDNSPTARSYSLLSSSTYNSPSPGRRNNSVLPLDDSLFLSPSFNNNNNTSTALFNNNSSDYSSTSEQQQQILDQYPLYREQKQQHEEIKAHNAELQKLIDDTTRKYSKALNESQTKIEELEEKHIQEHKENEEVLLRREAELREVRESLEDEIDKLIEESNQKCIQFNF